MEECKKINIFVATLISVGVASAFILLLLLLIAIIPLKADLSQGIIDFLLILSLCLGGFSGGYINGMINKKNGMAVGAAAGGVIAMALLICSLCTLTATVGLLTILKSVLIVIFAALGGICGVNKKKKRIKL